MAECTSAPCMYTTVALLCFSLELMHSLLSTPWCTVQDQRMAQLTPQSCQVDQHSH